MELLPLYMTSTIEFLVRELPTVAIFQLYPDPKGTGQLHVVFQIISILEIQSD